MFHIRLVVLLLIESKLENASCLDFSEDFKKLFSPGQFKKNHEQNVFLKKQQISVNQVLTYVNFFSRLSLFSKVIFVICSNIAMLYITVSEIFSMISQ